MLSEACTQKLIKDLAEFDPFLISHSKDRASWYVGFRKLPKGLTHKLRVSNHNERERYGYKWQLRLDGLERIDRKPYSRYFKTPDELIESFRKYYTTVSGDNLSPQKENYGDES